MSFSTRLKKISSFSAEMIRDFFILLLFSGGTNFLRLSANVQFRNL